jgi:hypothetical protein
MAHIYKTPQILVLSGLIFTLIATKGMDITAQAIEETPVALPSATLVKAMNIAQTNRPGQIRSVEGEKRRGVTVCEVELLDANGELVELFINAETGAAEIVEPGTKNSTALDRKPTPQFKSDSQFREY